VLFHEVSHSCVWVDFTVIGGAFVFRERSDQSVRGQLAVLVVFVCGT
jgi:hypothetical protein